VQLCNGLKIVIGGRDEENKNKDYHCKSVLLSSVASNNIY